MTTNISSRSIAKKRLKSVLYTDRTKALVDNKFLDLLKFDIYKAISRHIKISEKDLLLSLTEAEDQINIKLNVEFNINSISDCFRKDKND